MKKILITGGTGFLGMQLIPELAKKYEVSCLVRKKSNLNEIKKYNPRFILGDLAEKKTLDLATRDQDIIIHLATSHKKGKEDIDLIASKNLISASKKNNIKKIIFISSMATKRRVLDSYGETKIKIEEEIKSSGIDYTILRPTIIYSKTNLSLVGQSLKRIPFFIPIIGNGNYKLSPVYIDDVIAALIKVLTLRKSKNKIYEIGGGDKLSFNEIVNLCKQRFALNKINIHIPKKICQIIFSVFPIVSSDAIKGIDEDTNVDSLNLEKDLKIKPLKFGEGIKNVNL